MSELQIVLVVIVVFGLVGYLGSLDKTGWDRLFHNWRKR